jgi:hypothetical protein
VQLSDSTGGGGIKLNLSASQTRLVTRLRELAHTKEKTTAAQKFAAVRCRLSVLFFGLRLNSHSLLLWCVSVALQNKATHTPHT